MLEKKTLQTVANGQKLDDLKIVIKDRKLTITYENEKKDEDSYFVEKFTKSYYLSDDIIEKKIEAKDIKKQ